MGKKFYTIMIVPHAAAKFRRLKVSKNFVVRRAASSAC